MPSRPTCIPCPSEVSSCGATGPGRDSMHDATRSPRRPTTPRMAPAKSGGCEDMEPGSDNCIVQHTTLRGNFPESLAFSCSDLGPALRVVEEEDGNVHAGESRPRRQVGLDEEEGDPPEPPPGLGHGLPGIAAPHRVNEW